MDFMFNEGEEVRIVCSGSTLRNCAGGWNSDMEQFVGDGIVYTVLCRRSSNEGTQPAYRLHGPKDSETGWTWDERLLERVDDPIIPEVSLDDLFNGGYVV